MDEKAHERSGWSWWYLLLIIQFVAVLWPPFYNSAEPAWAGIPFFYWYQMLWVIIARGADRDRLFRDRRLAASRLPSRVCLTRRSGDTRQ